MQIQSIAEKRNYDAFIKHLSEKYFVSVCVAKRQHTINEEIAAFDNDGKILVNLDARGVEGSTFLIAHVLGHIIQTKRDSRYQELIKTLSLPKPLILAEPMEELIDTYELEAFFIGTLILKECIIMDCELMRRYECFMLTDLHHFKAYLKTGKISTKEEFQKVYAGHLKFSSYKNLLGRFEVGEFEEAFTLSSQAKLAPSKTIAVI